MNSEPGLYNWDRKHPAGKNTQGGLYTANRIAAQLFKTGLEEKIADYQFVFYSKSRQGFRTTS